jgi:uncharacterized protein
MPTITRRLYDLLYQWTIMLLDTSGLFSYHNPADVYHQSAATFFEAAGAKLTHSFVLAEFVALTYARKLPREPVLNFLESLFAHPEVEVIWVNLSLYQAAIALLAARLDKGYSLCDAVSFILMRQRGITEALTTDHHFEQERFLKLLF